MRSGYVSGGVLGCATRSSDSQYVVLEDDEGKLYLAVYRGKRVAAGDRAYVAEGDVKMYMPRDRVDPEARADSLRILRDLEKIEEE